MSGSVNSRLAAEYVLPLRWADDREFDDLTQYLGWLAGQLDVTVVDGSRPPIFERHAAAWGGRVRHLAPTVPVRGNGKIAGVISGVCAARHEAVIIADDDVRGIEQPSERAIELLDRGDRSVRRTFRPTPWHAKWDTGRSLVNRAVGGDYPGTYAVRRSTFVRMGGYAGDVLFENLELARTVIAHGGTEVVGPTCCFVDRRPPTTRHFLGSGCGRPTTTSRNPASSVVEAKRPARAGPRPSPLAANLRHPAIRRRDHRGAARPDRWPWRRLGRRIDGGMEPSTHPTAALLAYAGLAERMLTIWIAIGYRLRGGIPYAGSRIRLAAHSAATLAALGNQQPPASLRSAARLGGVRVSGGWRCVRSRPVGGRSADR